MEQSTNPEPPPDWMLPGFDPNSAKVAELRSILLQNNIAHSYTRKSQLVELFESQVRPMTPKLLKAHLSVKPSTEGIIDMRTGEELKMEDYINVPTQARKPRQKSSSKPPTSISLTDQESVTSTASKKSTSTTRKRGTAKKDQLLQPPDSEEIGSQADVESTPNRAGRASRRNQPQIPSSSSKPNISSSVVNTPSTRATPRRARKRKTIDQPSDPIPQSSNNEDELELESKPKLDPMALDQLSSGEPMTPSVPTKRRKSEFPIQTSTVEAELPISDKAISRPKNRRTTLHEAIEAGDGNYSDYNPFQSGAEGSSGGKSRSSATKPRKSLSKASPSAPQASSSIIPLNLPKSNTTSNISTLGSIPPPKTSTLFNPAQAPPAPPQPVSTPKLQTPRQSMPATLPRSATTSNVRTSMTPNFPSSARKSANFAYPTPNNKRLTMLHLQDDLEGDSSMEQNTPDQIFRHLVPSATSQAYQNNTPDQSFGTMDGEGEASMDIEYEDEDEDDSENVISKSSLVDPRDLRRPTRSSESPAANPTRAPPSSRRQSQTHQYTPIQQSALRQQAFGQQQTPLSRPPIQRIRLDQVSQTPATQRLKINRVPRLPPKRKGWWNLTLGQAIGYSLWFVFLAVAIGAADRYREKVRSIGYCDTGSSSNSYTRDRRLEEFFEADESNLGSEEGNLKGSLRSKINLIIEASRIVGLLPDCQSCPTHAKCERGEIVGCETDYVLKHEGIEKTMNELFPMFMKPKCVPDTEKLIKIVEIGSEITNVLRDRRAEVLCNEMGIRVTDELGRFERDDDEEGRKSLLELYGIEISRVKEILSSSSSSISSNQGGKNSGFNYNQQQQSEDLFGLALKDLERYKEIYRTSANRGGGGGVEDYEEDEKIVIKNFKSTDLGIKCRIKITIYRLIKKLKTVLIGTVLGFLSYFYLRFKLRKGREEKEKIRELVEITLNKLRDESWLHHTNPSLQPNPSIASVNLRDLILSYEHLPVKRQQVWKKVERVVEGNSNVRTKINEIRGESFKVWEWIGSYSGDLGSGIAGGGVGGVVVGKTNVLSNSSPINKKSLINNGSNGNDVDEINGDNHNNNNNGIGNDNGSLSIGRRLSIFGNGGK